MAELRRRLASRKDQSLSDGEHYYRLPSGLTKIAQAQEIAVLAVALVMMLGFIVSGALQTVVEGVD